MAKVVIVKSATNGSERRDGQQAVMAKRVAQAPTLQASLVLQAMFTDVTSRNRYVSAIALLQGEGSEDTLYRESVITNMEVSDADAVKAANSAFFLERRCCRTTTGLISSQTVCRVAGFSLVKTTNRKTFMQSTTAGHKGREQCPWKRRWCARRQSEREHQHV